jgi:hypothetical protein
MRIKSNKDELCSVTYVGSVISWCRLNWVISDPILSLRKIFLYYKDDLDSYRQQLTNVDWETMFGHDDVDTIVDIIANTILNIADNTIPNRFITVRKDSRPWITTSIMRRKNTNSIYLNFLSMLTLVKAFFVIRSICFCQLPSFEISKPRCLCSVT